MSNVALHPSERAALRAARRPSDRRAWRKAALIAAPIAAGIALSVQVAVSLVPAPATADPVNAARLSAQAAARQPDAMLAVASPGGGTTGTAELPPEPLDLPLMVAPGDAGVTAAQPFSMRGASFQDRARALECLTAAIYYEAASESDDGQRAVAQVVLNRARHPAFPSTVCGVIYQGSERASGCQFSYACDGSMARIPSRTGWARASRIAAAALAGYVFAPVGLATHYHTYAVTPAWNRTLVMTDAIGAHFFHRWKGYWGTAAAFHRSYAGHEPFPGPAPRAAPILPVIALARALPVAPAVTAPAQIQPAHRESGTSIDPSAAAAADSQILDRWKDSGKPLR
jgi:hypothetical protein